jgi:peptidoglycan/LPS O-acetylase OafA/YrhL
VNKVEKEIPVLDSLRAIAAWSVCLYHFICTIVGFVDKDSVVFRFFSFGSYGVQLFFVISGLVIPWSLYHSKYHIKDFFNFFAKRMIRIEPPYIVSIIIMVGIIYIKKFSPVHTTNVSVSIGQLLLHLGYLIPWIKDVNVVWINNVYWTLAIEFQYYILIGFMYFLFVSKKKWIRFIAYGLIAILPNIVPLTDFLPYWFPVFGLGILLFLYKSKHISLIEFASVSILFVVHIYIYNAPITWAAALISELTIVLLFNKSNKILTWLGKFSYSVYLMHAIVGISAVNLLSHYASSNLSKVMIVLVGVIVTFISSYLMNLWVEKPSKKLSSKLAYHKKDNEQR